MIMTISRNNIEAVLLDYLEGNLSPLLTAELMAFLAENPEYEKYLPEYEGHTGSADSTIFKEKFLLKKDFSDLPHITPDNFEEFCIASAEDLLRENDRARLQDFLSRNPEMQKVHGLFVRLKLQADINLVCPDKKRLKKPAGNVRYLRPLIYALGAAASVALLLLFVNRKPFVTDLSGTLTEPPGMESIASTPPVQSQAENTQVNQEKKPVAYPDQRTRPGMDTDPVPHWDEDVKHPVLTLLDPVPANPLSAGEPAPGIRLLARPVAHNVAVVDLIADHPAGKEDTPDQSFLTALIKKLNFWNAAGTAISGFNYLTESQVSLRKTMDENGKLTRLALDTQEYIISGSKTK